MSRERLLANLQYLSFGSERRVRSETFRRSFKRVITRSLGASGYASSDALEYQKKSRQSWARYSVDQSILRMSLLKALVSPQERMEHSMESAHINQHVREQLSPKASHRCRRLAQGRLVSKLALFLDYLMFFRRNLVLEEFVGV